MRMRADVSLRLLVTRIRMIEREAPKGKSGRYAAMDGTTRVPVKSMGDLVKFLKQGVA